jgi:hypothetical protein
MPSPFLVRKRAAAPRAWVLFLYYLKWGWENWINGKCMTDEKPVGNFTHTKRGEVSFVGIAWKGAEW